MTDNGTLTRKAKTTGFSRSAKSGSVGVQIPYESKEERNRLLDLLPNGRHDVTIEEELDEDHLYEVSPATYSGVGDFHSASTPDPEQGTISGRLSFRDEDQGFAELMHLANRDVKLVIQRTGPAGEEPAGEGAQGGEATDPPDTGGPGVFDQSDDGEAQGADLDAGWPSQPLTALCKHGATEAVVSRAGDHFANCGELQTAISENPNGWWKKLHRIGEGKAKALEDALAKLRAASQGEEGEAEGGDQDGGEEPGGTGTKLEALEAYGLPPLARERLEKAGFKTVEQVQDLTTESLSSWGLTPQQQTQVAEAIGEWKQDHQPA